MNHEIDDVGQTRDVLSFVVPFDAIVREEFTQFFDHEKVVARIVSGDTEEFFFDSEFLENIIDNFRHILASMRTGEWYKAEELLLEGEICINSVSCNSYTC